MPVFMSKKRLNEKVFYTVFLKTLIRVLCLLILLNSYVTAQNNKLWGELDSGRFSVAYTIKFKKDDSRSFLMQKGNLLRLSGRIVPIHIWYPTTPANKPRMKFREYLYLFDNAVNQIEKVESEKGFRKFTLAQELSESAVSALLNFTTAVLNNAAPIDKGKFPVVILGQGLYYESPVTHTILCEFLASNGFVVATTPLVGARSPFVKLDAVDLEAAVRDLEFVIGETRKLTFTDKEKLAVIGFDMGGLAGSILTMRNADVDAFVSLDSGILAEHNLRLVKAMPDYEPLRLRVPILHATHPAEETFARFGVREDWSFLNAAKYSDRLILRIAKMRHADYASRAMIEWSAAKMRDDLTAYRKRSFEMTVNYTLAFLNANLKNDSAATNFLARDNKSSDVALERKKPNRAPVMEEEFLNRLFTEGASKAAEIYRSQRAQFPGEQILEEMTLSQIGYNLLYRGQSAEAILIFTLNTEAYPGSANAFDSLAGAYQLSGNKQQAIRFYKKSLEVNPNNESVRIKIKELEQPQ
jgi:pimeloyl-ACP methyl ester carboxylesterase